MSRTTATIGRGSDGRNGAGQFRQTSTGKTDPSRRGAFALKRKLRSGEAASSVLMASMFAFELWRSFSNGDATDQLVAREAVHHDGAVIGVDALSVCSSNTRTASDTALMQCRTIAVLRSSATRTVMSRHRSDDRQAAGVVGGWTQTDLDRKLRAVASSAPEVQSRTHRPDSRIGLIARTMLQVKLPMRLRQQHFYRPAQQLAAVVPEQCLESTIDEHDGTRSVRHDDAIGGGFDQIPQS